MCAAFIAADIPMSKIANPVFRAWLEKETNHSAPHESTLRKQYLNIFYENTILFIRKTVKNRKIWISIDEIHWSTGRKVANVIIGILLSDSAGEKCLPVKNSKSVTQEH